MKLQEVKLTLRLKVNDDGYFPAIEAADVLAEFVQMLRKRAYTTSLENEGTYLHKAGAIQWSLTDGKSNSGTEEGLDATLRDGGRPPYPEAS